MFYIFYVNSTVFRDLKIGILVKNFEGKDNGNNFALYLSLFSNAFVRKTFYVIGKNDKPLDCS